MTAVLDRQRAHRSANTAANVEVTSPRMKTGESGEVTSGGTTASMEVLERGEVVRRKVVDVFPSGLQRF